MKRNDFVFRSGPFHIKTYSQSEVVYAQIYPAFPKYDLSPKDAADSSPDWKTEPRWAPHRAKGDGGGPGIFTSMAFGTELSNFLNQHYPPKQVTAWQNLVSDILDAKDKDILFAECSHCHTASSALKDWHFCPTCGHRLKLSK